MKTSRIRHGAALAAASVALSGGIAATAPSAPAQAATVKLKVVQHNTDQDPARWAKVVALAESGNWDALTVQEVCVGWKNELQAKHPDWTIAYHQQQPKSDCAGGAKGNVAIRPGAGSRFAQAFNVAGEGKTFGIACVAFAKAGRNVHACSTHFSVYDANPEDVRLRQARRVKEITGTWIAKRNHSVVVGGDLNTTPSAKALNPIYQFPAGRSSGRFVEAEQLRLGSKQRVGRNTVEGRKIDYLFFSTNRTPLSAGGSLDLVSVKRPEDVKEPHKILKAITTLR